jgi:hypothetical protein
MANISRCILFTQMSFTWIIFKLHLFCIKKFNVELNLIVAYLWFFKSNFSNCRC